jgi:hypothetical protein
MGPGSAVMGRVRRRPVSWLLAAGLVAPSPQGRRGTSHSTLILCWVFASGIEVSAEMVYNRDWACLDVSSVLGTILV